MSGYALQRQPLPGVLLQQLPDEIPRVLRHPRGPSDVDPLDPPVRRAVALGLEGRDAHEELVQEHAEGPRVDLLVVLAPLDHLGGEVVERPAQRVPAGGRGVDGPAEVGDLDVVLRPEEEVLRLDVLRSLLVFRLPCRAAQLKRHAFVSQTHPVDHVLVVAVLHGLAQVGDESGGRPLAEPSLGRELLVKLAPRRVLEDEVNVLVVVEVAVHSARFSNRPPGHFKQQANRNTNRSE